MIELIIMGIVMISMIIVYKIYIKKNEEKVAVARSIDLKANTDARDTLRPQLAIIEVGHRVDEDYEAAHIYFYEEDISEDDLLLEIKDLIPHYNKVIVRLPLPKHISTNKVAIAMLEERTVRRGLMRVPR